MEHLFCTYKQSLELKHLGFNEPCFTWFWNDIGLYNGLEYGKHNQSEYYISAPLKSQAINWIREKYGYFCSPTESDNGYSKKYDFLITKNTLDNKSIIKFIGYKNTYQEAESTCIDMLIELIKNERI